jgi:methyltransferase OMS1, mitochondrial
MAANFVRRASLVVAGTGVTVSVAYLTYEYVQSARADQEDTKQQLLAAAAGDFSFVSDPHRKERFNDIAARYDAMIDMDERVMGMTLLRRYLLYRHAKGTVLEMAAGTGRNLSYYLPRKVDRVVLTDASDPMLQQAQQKILQLRKEEEDNVPTKNKPQFAVLQADSTHLTFRDHTFDTVVDTFGLCSFDDPVAVLKEMQRVCKPDGKILLLEHGRSTSWQWVNKILDHNVERHAKNWGCIHNRDLDHLLEESGLQIETKFTWHFGTTYFVVGRPNNNNSNSCSSITTKKKQQPPE